MTANSTELISVSSSGVPGSDESGNPFYSPPSAAMSADGRFVAFSSAADNLVDGDTNGVNDIFVRDRLKGTTEVVSVSTSGQLGNGTSFSPAISRDGRYVAFISNASNFIADDTDGRYNEYVHDRLTGTTVLVNVNLDGKPSGLSGSDDPPSISADGRYVLFADDASNIVPGRSNGKKQIYLRDLQLGTTELLSLSTSGEMANHVSSDGSISADGRYVVFTSVATNLINGDTNGAFDIFVRDRQAGTTTIVSVSSDGALSNSHSTDPKITPDGRFVVFQSSATNLTTGKSDIYSMHEIFVRDLWASTTERISERSPDEPGGGQMPSISDDGRYVAFESQSATLVPGTLDGQIFVRDRVTGQIENVSDARNWRMSDSGSWFPAISADGRYVTFESNSANLDPNATNRLDQVYAGSVDGPPGPKLISLTVESPNIVSGDTTFVTANLDGPAPDGGMWLNIGTMSHGVAYPWESGLFVPAGRSSGKGHIGTSNLLKKDSKATIIVAHRWDRAAVTFTVTPIPVLSDASVSPTRIDAGSTATGTIQLTSAAPSDGYVVKLKNSRPSYYTVPDSVTVPSGANSATFPITAPEDAPDCSGYVTASHENSPSVFFVVRSVARKLSALTADPNPVSGGLPCHATVTINIAAPAGGYKVSLVSSKPSFLIPPASVTIPEGQSSATFDVETKPVAFGESGLITASHPGSINAMVVVKVIVPAMSALTVSPNPILSGGEATATVSIESPAPPGGYVVTLSRSNPAMLSAPTSVTIPEGATSATFVVRATVTGFGGIGYLTASHPGAANLIAIVVSVR